VSAGEWHGANPNRDRDARTFATLPEGVVRVRLEGQSAAGLAKRLTALPGVTVVTGPDSYVGDRLYLTVMVSEGKEAGGG
jgi:hypothetical protein